jgi:hypothetical protein
MQSRRKFLSDCSLLAAGSCLAPVAGFAENASGPARVAGTPSFGAFLRQVNTAFTVQAGPVATQLLLVAARPDSIPRSAPEMAANERFSLQFRGPAHAPLKQDTYLLAHPHLGPLTIFIVPVGRPDPAGHHYEAVFDRPVDAEALARQISRAPRRVQPC